MDYVTLNNGVKMPKLGYGVYQTPPEDTERCVLDAIEVGIAALTLPKPMEMRRALETLWKNAGFQEKKSLLQQKYGLATPDMRRPRPQLRSPLKILKQII